MTKEHYLEMCEMLKTEPVEENTPVEFDDLPDDVQMAMQVYNMLQDNWDTVNGIYLGKIRVGITEIFRLLDVEDHKTTFLIVSIIDRIRSELLNTKNKKPAR